MTDGLLEPRALDEKLAFVRRASKRLGREYRDAYRYLYSAVHGAGIESRRSSGRSNPTQDAVVNKTRVASRTAQAAVLILEAIKRLDESIECFKGAEKELDKVFGAESLGEPDPFILPISREELQAAYMAQRRRRERGDDE